MPDNIIVGAGLAGLVAGINLAKDGREVLVLERESRIGGSPLYHPSPEGTPVDLEGLERYTGIDISPAVSRFDSGGAVVYGEMVPVEMDAISSVMIERGPRSTSLDHHLYEMALAEGVSFEFERPIWSGDDLARLPADTIVATGLYFEGFDAVRVPYLTSFHYVARQAVEDTETSHVTVYHGEFTRDYSYTCSVNGIRFAHVFQRTPIGTDTLKAFEEQVFVSEGFEFDAWRHFTFPVPAACISNPRLFAGDKILAGTLAGCMEPYMFFGILGALVSGRIAALAVTDKAGAYGEFQLAASAFRSAYVAKKLSSVLPRTIHRLALRSGLSRLSRPEAARVLKRAMPGWKNLEKARVGTNTNGEVR